MAGRILALVLATAATTGSTDTRINLFDACDALFPGTSITLGGHRVTRAENGACTIENTNDQRPTPTLKREGQS